MFLGEPFKCSVCLQGTALPLLPAHPQLPSKPIELVLFLSALYVPHFSATSVSCFCLALLLGQKQEVVPLTQVWLCASWSYVLPLPGEWGPRACQLAKHMASRAVSFVGMCCRNAAFWDISLSSVKGDWNWQKGAGRADTRTVQPQKPFSFRNHQ